MGSKGLVRWSVRACLARIACAWRYEDYLAFLTEGHGSLGCLRPLSGLVPRGYTEAAFEANPNRFKGQAPKPQRPPDAVWINPPATPETEDPERTEQP